ncbi:MAG: PAS domain S-box protein [Candidatus Scalindua sp.]
MANKQLFLKVEQGRDEWQKTFDAITDIITIHDKDNRIIRANKAFFEKFNVSAEQLSDRKCYEIFHDIDTPWHNCPLDRSIKSLRPEIEEVDDPHMGGIFLVSTYPLFDEKGKFYGVVHQAKDITKMKKVEREIIKEKEYTEDLIETAHDAIVCVDEKGTINVWNKSAEIIFGYVKSEILGKSISTIIPEDILDRFLQVSKIITISRVIEVSGKTKDGIVIPVEMSISSREIEKGGYTFTIIMRDITFQKEAKKQLVEKANELRKVNKELEDFVYIVSHDLKEPLFAIGGYTSRLFRLYEDTFDDKGQQYIDRIKINIERISQKIQEIMEVLKVGRVAYDFKNNDSGAIVTDVVNTLESKVKAKRIKVSIEDNLPTVLCDEKRMKDVFSNLVTNAIKFMGNDKQTACRGRVGSALRRSRPSRHRLAVDYRRHGAKTPHGPLNKGKYNEGPNRESNRIGIGCHKNGSYYKFHVEDTGIGIREEYREQIFKVFRRLKDVETEGTGVGLAIVKKIVEQHKGKIWAENPAGNGRGTRFCFTIPVTKTTSDHHDTHKVMAGS